MLLTEAPLYNQDEITAAIAELLNRYPEALFGKFLTKKEVMLCLQYFFDNPDKEEIFFNMEVRYADDKDKDG